jgi:GGDEF domain-containing protein
MRLESGEHRDAIAHARDLAALARDRAADARDRAMAQHEVGAEGDGGERLVDTEETVRSKARRHRAAQHYAQAAEYRALAAQDRQAAAQDRERAARDRLSAANDPPTRARAQTAVLADVAHELDRCRRTNGRLVVAFVEAVAGDSDADDLSEATLERVAARVTSQLRSYDLVVRLGGGRLVCALSNMTLADARERFAAITAAIADASDESSIQAGFADAAPDETATELIARARQQLLAGRSGVRDSRPELSDDTSTNRR